MNAVLWWLLQNTIAVAVMIPFVLLICRAFRTRPAVQHVLWLVLLIKFLLPPVVELPWSVDSLLALGEPASINRQLPVVSTSLPPKVEPIVVEPEVIESPIEMAAPAVPQPLITLGEIGKAVVVLWALGCGVTFLVQLGRIARHRTLICAGTAAPRHLTDEIERIARQMGVRPLRALIVRGIASPFVWCSCWLRLVWPESFLAEKDVLRSRGMIAHELAHVRRRDHWIARLAFAATLLWWWNPLFWFVRRQLREAAELACDALAIAALPDERHAYAELFLELSSNSKPGTLLPAVGMSIGVPSSFERRLTMILSERVSGTMSWRGTLIAALLALVAVPHWSAGQSGGTSSPPLTDFEKRLLRELRQKELASEIDQALTANVAVDNDLALAHVDQLQIVNMMRAPGERLVNLKIIIAEINRAAAQKVGIDFAPSNDKSITHLPNPTDNGNIMAQLNALKSLNYARQISEPNLTVLNGMPGTFRSGGEFPVLKGTAGATPKGPKDITMVPFGVSLKVTPYITDKNRIRLSIDGWIRTRDSAKAKIESRSVPGMIDQVFASTIELMSGTQTIAFTYRSQGGESSDNQAKKRPQVLDKSPDNEKDFLVLITPELVHPMEYPEVPPTPKANSSVGGTPLLGTTGAARPKSSLDRESTALPDRMSNRLWKLELETDRQFPDSAIRLQLVDNRLIVSGQPVDSVEATKVICFVRDEIAKVQHMAKERRLVRQNVEPALIDQKLKQVAASLQQDRDAALRSLQEDRAHLLREQKRLLDEIKSLQTRSAPAVATSPKSGETSLFRLTNVKATDIAKALVDLFAHDGGTSVTIVAEPSTNTLLVRGAREQLNAIEAIVARLDEVASRGKGAADAGFKGKATVP